MRYLHWWRFDGWHEYLGNCWHFQGHRLSLPPPFSRIFGEGPVKNSTTKFADRLDFAVNKTLSEWVNDGRMGRDLSHFMHNSMDGEIFFRARMIFALIWQYSLHFVWAAICSSQVSSKQLSQKMIGFDVFCLLLILFSCIHHHHWWSLIPLLALPLPRV